MSNGCVTWSATYSMAVMPALYNYYLYTGDLRFVRAHWPAVVRQMQWDAQQVDTNGLFSVGAADSADWNVENVTGELTYANALYALALQSASKLALAGGQGAQAKAWSRKAIAIKAAVNRQLWNATTGVYDASTTERGSFVQDANVTAILAGIPPLSRSREILKVLRRALRSPFGPLDVSTPAPSGYTQDVSPYMGSFNVLADFAAGDQAGALSLIRQEWGYMVRHDPGGVDWERIQLNGIPAGGALADSSAHAWSTGPTAAMSQYVLGTVPDTAGYRNWTVAPEPGELRWAQGVVPTPHGPITVRWRRSGTGLFVLTVAAPRGTSGVVEVPVLGRDRTIFRNGTIVWSHGGPPRGVRARRAGRAVAVAQGAGSSTYAWAG
jgi:alpha-L-rhamnosidase